MIDDTVIVKIKKKIRHGDTNMSCSFSSFTVVRALTFQTSMLSNYSLSVVESDNKNRKLRRFDYYVIIN